MKKYFLVFLAAIAVACAPPNVAQIGAKAPIDQQVCPAHMTCTAGISPARAPAFDCPSGAVCEVFRTSITTGSIVSAPDDSVVFAFWLYPTSTGVCHGYWAFGSNHVSRLGEPDELIVTHPACPENIIFPDPTEGADPHTANTVHSFGTHDRINYYHGRLAIKSFGDNDTLMVKTSKVPKNIAARRCGAFQPPCFDRSKDPNRPNDLVIFPAGATAALDQSITLIDWYSGSSTRALESKFFEWTDG